MKKDHALNSVADLTVGLDALGGLTCHDNGELIKVLFEDSPFFLVISAPDGRILKVNRAVGHALQYSSGEMAGTPLAAYVPAGDLAVLTGMLEQMAMGRQAVKRKTGLIGKDGRIFLVVWSGRMIPGPQGKTANFLAGVDITKLWQSNEEFSRIRDYLENILDNSPDAIGIVDAKGRFVKWNRMAEQLYGYSFEELRGRSAFGLYADQGKLQEMLACLRSEGFVRKYEIAMRHKNGALLPFEVSLTMLKDRGGSILGSVCVARDLVDTKQTMRDLEATNKRLQEEVEERRQTWTALEASQNLYQTIFENTGTAMVIIEADSTISLANAEFVKLSCCLREEIEGKKNWTEFFKDETLQSMGQFHSLQQGGPDGAPRNFEACFASVCGQLKHVCVTIAAIPETRKSVVSFLDITERKQAEEELRRSNEELEQRSREISQLNEMLDLLQVCQNVDEIYYVVGRCVRKLFPADSGRLYLLNKDRAFLESALEWGENVTGEQTFVFHDCWALRQGKLYSVGDSGGGVACRHVGALAKGGYLCVPLITDGGIKGLFHLQIRPLNPLIPSKISRRIMDSKERLAVAVTDHISLALANYELRETLRMQSIRDPLTGLFNRRFMEESLERELSQARRTNFTVAVMMLDIDFFKQFNDTYGHEAGDELLREMGKVLLNCGRAEDVACRYGGEEFFLILPGMSLDVAQIRAEEIRRQIAAIRIQYGGKELNQVTTSIGLAAFDQHGDTASQILKAADTALYQAKRRGRNCVVVAEE
ncbi:MAG: diguanylate cyclase [Desulfocapsaceae bacterium]|nr:diguanylate cyclase [Desulfocapsaceae bacterium]